MKTPCPYCGDKKWFWKGLCRDCTLLFGIVQSRLGHVGLGQLMDELIATGIAKPKIKRFLETDVRGAGSLMDQILARLTNDLAAGMGVKGEDTRAADVRRIRENPVYGSSSKPIKD